MPKIIIDKDKCKGCLLCVSVCPKKLFSQDKNLNAKGLNPVKFQDKSGCLGCAFCAIICPDCCIEVYK
ncbi:MAG: 2-oxoacid:acceptor oxidoreductase [Candidatus Omnitrophica bacterium CG08_land_8_20_14_0_20_41_16]|uniref:2-oxoacid:acceptor oxidoreductase n=1 Tax=Candidatus Sherwoodlollariibacterium unditelluris TaxID=1974757 RepID=A0A2G9YIP7_9BACT|nr:MAG: 2-oxoacid:acceptor oxidoreductase [Candidatus Omnitrophica bacterium CG23_combo_of_CG06-09_8_20_14_all_41_10]PIS33517.1 MAG: 2-oxoacid:acceptor oxidoreductase [Candidatus Omnitrophica bacterium CG08_land_8_20_14_0_20_41_16]